MTRLHSRAAVRLALAATCFAACAEDPGPGASDAALDGSADAADVSADVVADAVDAADDVTDVADATDGSSPDASDDTVGDAETDTPPPCDGLAYDVNEDGSLRCYTSVCEVPGSAAAATTATIAGFRVVVNRGDGSIAVTPPHGGDPIWELPGPCTDPSRPSIRLGFGEPRVENDFGAFRITFDGRGSELDFTGPIGGSPTIDESEEGRLRVSWRLLAGGEASLVFSARSDRDLAVGLEYSGDREGDAAGEVAWACGADTAYFGLGTQATGMDLRGGDYPLWTQEQGIGKPERYAFPLQNAPEAAYAPMGVWHSTDGLSALLASDVYHRLALCAADVDAERVVLTSYPGLPSFVLLAGETPRDRIANLTEYVGRLNYEPIAWTFAPWNDTVGGPERVEAVADALRDNDIPSSVIWAEDWIGGSQTPTGYRLSYAWEVDDERYPDLDELIASLHDRGFAFLGYFNTFVPTPTRMYTEGVEGGILAVDEDGDVIRITDPAFREAGLVDLTNPDARAWFAGYLRTAAEDLGMDGWMADFTEWMPVTARMADGRSGWEYHNQWPLDFQQLVLDVMTEVHAAEPPPGERNFVYFVRSGWASANGGTPGIAPTMWAGDQMTDWSLDDGFPTVIPIGVHAGLSGVAIMGSDIAGYASVGRENTSKELFYRWTVVGAFQGIMRTHHGSDECGNWAFDRDSETLDHFRRWARIRTRLLPHLLDLARESMETGLPLNRHPWLAEPGTPALWRDGTYRFFLGNDLLVAPALSEGGAEVTVPLPGPGWAHLLSGEAVVADPSSEGSGEGSGTGQPIASIGVPATEVVVLVRPGTVLPLLPRVVSTFYPGVGDGVSSLDDIGDAVTLALYPGPDGTLGPATVAGGIRVEGVLAGPPAGASFGGFPLSACTDDDAPGCITPSGAVRLAGDAELVTAGGTLRIEATEGRRYEVALAANAWGSLADVPPAPDLDAVVPPPCVEE